VFKWGKSRERIERKDHLASAEYYTKSLEKRELLKKEGERKREKVFAKRVGYLGVCRRQPMRSF